MLIGVSAPCAGAPEWAAGTGWRWAAGTDSCHLHPLAWNQEPHRRPPYMLVPVPVPSRRWCGKCRQIGPFLDELVSKHPGVVRDGGMYIPSSGASVHCQRCNSSSRLMYLAAAAPLMRLPPPSPHVPAPPRSSPPAQTFAKFDTTQANLEALSAQLGVKALPAFKFFKAS